MPDRAQHTKEFADRARARHEFANDPCAVDWYRFGPTYFVVYTAPSDDAAAIDGSGF